MSLDIKEETIKERSVILNKRNTLRSSGWLTGGARSPGKAKNNSNVTLMTRQQHVHSEHIGSESTADLKATRKGDNSSVLGFV